MGLSAQVPLVITQDRVINQLQQNLTNKINAITVNPLLNGQLLEGQTLSSGNNIINHGLGRALLGWFLTRVGAAASVYDKQATNSTPNLTLVLNSSVGNLAVDIYVF